MTTPTTRSHDVVVARVLADAHPVKPLWPSRARVACWVAFEVGALAIAALLGLRHDLARVLADPPHLVELAILGGTAAVAAAGAFRFAVPGRAPALRAEWAMTAAAAVVVVLAWLEPPPGPPVPLLVCLRCAVSVIAFAVVPCALLLAALRRGAVLDALPAAGWAGAAAFALALASMRVACPIDDRAHLFAWHVIPAVVAASLFASRAARRLDPLARVAALR